MKRATKVLVLLLIAVFLLGVFSGCGLFGRNTDKYRATTAFTVGDEKITIGKLIDTYNNYYNTYYSYITQGYITADYVLELAMDALYTQYMKVDAYKNIEGVPTYTHAGTNFANQEYLSDEEYAFTLRYIKYVIFGGLDSVVESYASADYTLAAEEEEDTSRDFVEYDDLTGCDTYSEYVYMQNFVNEEMDEYFEKYYNGIIERGLYSAKLYYNLANAYFKCGETGPAILYYNRALRMSPASDDIRYNLEMAEAMTKDKIAVVPEFFLKRWVRQLRNSMSCTAWSAISLAAFAAALAMLLMFLLSERLSIRKTGFYGTIVAMLLFAATTAFALAERRDMLARKDAVVMSSAISVKSSPDRSATDLFVLHEGTKVRIVTEIDDWYEIVIADGKKGWTEGRNIEKI